LGVRKNGKGLQVQKNPQMFQFTSGNFTETQLGKNFIGEPLLKIIKKVLIKISFFVIASKEISL